MNRRDVFKALAGVATVAASGVSVAAVAARPRYGPVDVFRHRVFMSQGVNLHVFYQGEDVTSRCRYADDTGVGMAQLFRLDADGHKYRNPSDRLAAMEIVYGVTMRDGSPFNRSSAMAHTPSPAPHPVPVPSPAPSPKPSTPRTPSAPPPKGVR